MLQLAGTLIIDLGLSLPYATGSADPRTESKFSTYTEDVPVPKQLDSDGMRAVLGFQFMNSMCVFQFWNTSRTGAADRSSIVLTHL